MIGQFNFQRFGKLSSISTKDKLKQIYDDKNRKVTSIPLGKVGRLVPGGNPITVTPDIKLSNSVKTSDKLKKKF